MGKAPTLWRLGHVLTTTNWQSLCGLNEATVEGAWIEGHGVWMVKSERATCTARDQDGWPRWDREVSAKVTGGGSVAVKSRVSRVSRTTVVHEDPLD